MLGLRRLRKRRDRYSYGGRTVERVGGREEQNQEEEEEGHRHEVRHQRRVPTGDFNEEKREGNVPRRGCRDGMSGGRGW